MAAPTTHRAATQELWRLWPRWRTRLSTRVVWSQCRRITLFTAASRVPMPNQPAAAAAPATFTASPTPQLPLLARQSFHTSAANSSAWAAAVSVASNVVTNAVRRATAPASPTDGLPHIDDPLRAVAKEMKFLTGNLRKLLGSGHPVLQRVANYYTQSEGKHMRPLIVLLMSRATSLCPKTEAKPGNSGTGQKRQADLGGEWGGMDRKGGDGSQVDAAISPLDILADANPAYTSDSPPVPPPQLEPHDILPSQHRLAEIVELIHTASLLHDDVIDHSTSRRGEPSANITFGNKMAVLAGDFLFGRASVALARLRNAEVLELLATVMANLVEGEFMQLKNSQTQRDDVDDASPVAWSNDTFTYYLQKTYLKTASLISKSCRAAAVLGGADSPTIEAAYAYGRNLGLAFQLVDDLLDYTRSGAELGKPSGADLQLGLATAPLLFAWKTIPELGTLVGRRFSGEGDVEKARKLVLGSDGIEQTRALAQDYGDQAVAAIMSFPESEAKTGLIEMVQKTLDRNK